MQISNSQPPDLQRYVNNIQDFLQHPIIQKLIEFSQSHEVQENLKLMAERSSFKKLIIIQIVFIFAVSMFKSWRMAVAAKNPLDYIIINLYCKILLFFSVFLVAPYTAYQSPYIGFLKQLYKFFAPVVIETIKN